MCQQSTAVVDDRSASLKRELVNESSAALDAMASKKAAMDKHQFKSKGNEQQFDHQVLELLGNPTATLEKQDINKAMGLLQEGNGDQSSNEVDQIRRQKRPRLANRC